MSPLFLFLGTALALDATYGSKLPCQALADTCNQPGWKAGSKQVYQNIVSSTWSPRNCYGKGDSGAAAVKEEPFEVSTQATISEFKRQHGWLPDVAFLSIKSMKCSSLQASGVVPGDLRVVEIPGSLTKIERDAFQFCSSLASVTLPHFVTDIGECAFQCCSSLASVTIPDSVEIAADVRRQLHGWLHEKKASSGAPLGKVRRTT